MTKAYVNERETTRYNVYGETIHNDKITTIAENVTDEQVQELYCALVYSYDRLIVKKQEVQNMVKHWEVTVLGVVEDQNDMKRATWGAYADAEALALTLYIAMATVAGIGFSKEAFESYKNFGFISISEVK